jgi:hypothetical protein
VTNVATYSTVGHLAEIRMVSPEFREGNKSTWETTSPFTSPFMRGERKFIFMPVPQHVEAGPFLS